MTLIAGQVRGDLRKLREEAREDPAKERRLLEKFKCIGETWGADIFFREAQLVWDEHFSAWSRHW